jgi:hypothetical protein
MTNTGILAPDALHEFVPGGCGIGIHDLAASLSRLGTRRGSKRLRRIVDRLAHGARGDRRAGNGVDLPGIGLGAVLDGLDLVGQRREIALELDVEGVEVGKEFLVGDDLVADARRLAHRHDADADHTLAVRLVAEHDAHRVGVALGAALGGDAGELAGFVVGGEELDRSRRTGAVSPAPTFTMPPAGSATNSAIDFAAGITLNTARSVAMRLLAATASKVLW